MADNTTINAGTGGDVIASDDIGGVKHQRVKVEFGADGSATDVSAANPLPVAPSNSSTSSVTNVAASASSVTLKAANASRKALYIFNAGTSDLFVKFGATATTTTSFSVMIPPNGFFEFPDDPIYTGIVDGIWTATGGNGALVTELT